MAGKKGPATRRTREEVIAFVKSHDGPEWSITKIAEVTGRSRTYVSQIVRDLRPLLRGESCDDGKYITARLACRRYGFTKSNFGRNVQAAERRGYRVRRIRVLTDKAPVKGQDFFYVPDLIKASKKVARRHKALQRALLDGNAAIERPIALGLECYGTLLTLCDWRLAHSIWPSYSELAAVEEVPITTLRWRLGMLEKKRYIQRRNTPGRGCQYRILKCPAKIRVRLRQQDPLLIKRFPKGG